MSSRLTASILARNVRFGRCGTAQVLELVDEEVPPPHAGEVRVKVRAFGLNQAEIMFRHSYYFEKPAFPARLEYEASGTVDAVGEGVNGFAVGDEVSLFPLASLTRWGTWGEVVNLPADYLVRHDRPVDAIRCAAALMAFVTAHGALSGVAGMAAGDVVVIGASSSSVGLTAVALARQAGATSIALTRTREKRERLVAAGADHVVVTEEEDVASRIHDITGGEGAAMAFDPVGGPLLSDVMRGIRCQGVVVLYGRLDSRETVLPMQPLIGGALTVRGFVFSDYVADSERRRKLGNKILSDLSSGILNPIIDRVYPLSQIVEANQRMESGRQLGIIVVTIGRGDGE